MSPSELERKTATAYEAYCEAVGGVAYNGDPLPSWEEFSADLAKQRQANAWREAVAAIS